jgi:hypothetical protein
MGVNGPQRLSDRAARLGQGASTRRKPDASQRRKAERNANKRGLRNMTVAITIETENLGGPDTTFRMSVNGAVVLTGLSLDDADHAVGRSLLRIALSKNKAPPKPAPAPTILNESALRGWLSNVRRAA